MSLTYYYIAIRTDSSSGYFINKKSDGGPGISSEDAGFYTCNITSTAGFTRIVHINVTVLGM